MKYIQNPIIKGFNPDPSIIAVGNDYYIANSTFEWFPGVQIHHSTDLANWELIAHPLNSVSKLDMRGVPDSCGVWAPCLSYDDGTFYLVYSNVKSFDGVWKDTPNYLITTNDIRGEWSAPIFLNSSGFDGSMFHDEDGKKWYLSMLVDHRGGKFFGGIIMQEYSVEKQKLVGPVHHIFEGSELGKTEGPHLYKLNGYYYLITAEGGTEYGHAVTIARSKSITGPYELHPQHPLFSATEDSLAPLQKTGHGDLVWTPEGKCYSVFLTSRPLSERGRCTLGRETAIEEVVWKDDNWPYPVAGNRFARLEVPAYTNASENADLSIKDDFDSPELDINYASLRVPVTEEWLSLSERPGFLRLKGRESLNSTWNQSLIARRVQHFELTFSTCVDFEPENFQQLCGIVCYYNTSHYFYLHIAGRDGGGKELGLLRCDAYKTTSLTPQNIDLSKYGKVYLKAEWDKELLTFYYAVKEGEWIQIGKTQDASILSDDYVQHSSGWYRAAFTGAFVGVACQDLTGEKKHADFDWVEYQGKDISPTNTELVLEDNNSVF